MLVYSLVLHPLNRVFVAQEGEGIVVEEPFVLEGCVLKSLLGFTVHVEDKVLDGEEAVELGGSLDALLPLVSEPRFPGVVVEAVVDNGWWVPWMESQTPCFVTEGGELGFREKFLDKDPVDVIIGEFSDLLAGRDASSLRAYVFAHPSNLLGLSPS